jgi:hypothetical protein
LQRYSNALTYRQNKERTKYTEARSPPSDQRLLDTTGDTMEPIDSNRFREMLRGRSTCVERLQAVAIVRAINVRGGYLLIDIVAHGARDLIIRRRHLVPSMLTEQVIRHRIEICKVLSLGLRVP